MRKHSQSHAQLSELTISIPQDLQQQVTLIATQQGETLSEVICMALVSYIDTYSKHPQPEQSRMSLEEARVLMRQFGHGLGKGQAPHNGARHHDKYLYSHK